tara:strand:+ start:30 stop:1136 length:1107 start_codon:yes stop_codon:yes gene_type:complete
MSSKKILHLAKWYPNKVETLLGIFVRKHIKSIQEYHSNKVISIYQSDEIDSNIERLETNFEQINQVVFYYKKGWLNKLKVFLAVSREINRSDCHLIHAHIMGWTSTLAYLYSRYKSIPFVITEHWSGYRKGSFNALSFSSKYIRRFTAKSAAQLHVVSSFLKLDMEKCFLFANYKIVPNIVDGITQSNPIKNEKFSFIFVGDLDQKNKNIFGIIEGFNKLNKELNNVKLDIIGTGKNHQECLDLCSKLGLDSNVKFHGAKSNTEVFKRLQKSHVLVLNSFFETFSIICAEALLCGVPVISTKCGGPESFLNDKTGVLIDIGSETQLEDAMRTLYTNYKFYTTPELSKVAKQFSSETIGRKLINCYELV